MRLVIMREQARLGKDWGLADATRERLTAAGVTLFDKTNSWRSSDGRTGRIPNWSEIEAGQSPEAIIAQQDDKVTHQGDGSESHIKYMIQMREQARAAKDWAQSDKIRDDLRAIGVEVFDKEKMWRAKSGISGVIIGFLGSSGPTDLEISTLVVQRERARQSSDYGTADMIRDELRKGGVEISDKDKCWRCSNGRSGPIPVWATILGAPGGNDGRMAQHMTMGSMSGAGDLRNQIIQAALQSATNPNTAARTLMLLQQANSGMSMGMAPASMPGAMQRKAIPSLAPAAPRPNANNPDLQEAMAFINHSQASGHRVTDAEITWLVELREKMRQQKDFGSADSLRNSMRSTLSVELYEKEKQWVAADGRQGSIPLWNNLVA